MTTCEHCAHRFEAPGESAGGLTNCPRCELATKVEGGSDRLWNLLVGLGALATVVIVTLAYISGGPALAGLTLLGCALAAAVVRLSA